MKKLLLIIPLLFSCKSTKKVDCDAYGGKTDKKYEITLTKH